MAAMYRRSGLGRGLEALLPVDLPGAGGLPAEDVDALLQAMVDDGLDGISALVPLDVCAYLHELQGGAPHLFLRGGERARTQAGVAFELLGQMRELLDDEVGERPVHLAGFGGVAVTTAGPRSRGVHVLGRRDGTLERVEMRAVARLCRSLGGALHTVEWALRPVVDEGFR